MRVPLGDRREHRANRDQRRQTGAVVFSQHLLHRLGPELNLIIRQKQKPALLVRLAQNMKPRVHVQHVFKLLVIGPIQRRIRIDRQIIPHGRQQPLRPRRREGFGAEGQQFLAVELGVGFADLVQRKKLHHFVDGHSLFIAAGAPAQEGEEIQQHRRQISIGPEIVHENFRQIAARHVQRLHHRHLLG